MGTLDLDGSAVVDAIDQPTVVLDDSDDILTCNGEFESLVDGDAEGALDASLSGVPDLLDRIAAREPGIVTVEADAGRQYFDVHVSAVCDDDGRCVGDMVLLHDVTAQQRQQRELERQNEQLDQFASLVSHDLRNPLDVAIGRTTALAELVDGPEGETHIDELEAAHARMRHLIEDVLTLAREGRSIDEKAGVSLGTVAEDAWSHVDTGETGLTVETDATVRADRDCLERVFQNLFRNAVEHASTRQGADAVRVTVGELEDRSGFYVADDGAGVPDDVCEQVFEAGVTGDGGNTGLGLAIVRNVADAHGWDSVVTTAETGGARFEFRGVELAIDGHTSPGH